MFGFPRIIIIIIQLEENRDDGGAQDAVSVWALVLPHNDSGMKSRPIAAGSIKYVVAEQTPNFHNGWWVGRNSRLYEKSLFRASVCVYVKRTNYLIGRLRRRSSHYIHNYLYVGVYLNTIKSMPLVYVPQPCTLFFFTIPRLQRFYGSITTRVGCTPTHVTR